MTTLSRSMTDSCEIVRWVADGDRVEGEARPESVRWGPYPCRLALDRPGDADPHDGRQIVRGRVYLPPEAAPRAGETLLISAAQGEDAEEWRVLSCTRLVRRRREVASEVVVTRVVDH